MYKIIIESACNRATQYIRNTIGQIATHIVAGVLLNCCMKVLQGKILEPLEKKRTVQMLRDSVYRKYNKKNNNNSYIRDSL